MVKVEREENAREDAMSEEEQIHKNFHVKGQELVGGILRQNPCLRGMP